MSLISCENAAFAYEGKTVVEGLNFCVEQGNYLCILGENGSGKSTLMKGLLGLMKPKHGEIKIGDGLKQTQIGYLPQQTSAQKDFPASVYEVVLSGLLNKRGIRPFYSWREHETAEKNIEKLGISNLKKKSFRELSGGQQQRVLLARALCATEKLLLLDEPVSGLDPIVTAELYETIESLRRDSGISIIMISHDVRSGIEYATHILHLRNRQIFFGETESYKNSEAGKYFLAAQGAPSNAD
ncbi:MAG: metal ABC transporter ATP-binding protein [Defluviitaleaceae bacterium]|nr:metal ABC transporter ATP-binding protein [Defluviitaleaceae bacterium]